jgi:hypothetical protein
MREALELAADRLGDPRMAVASVHDSDAAREVDVATAFDVPDFSVLRAFGVDGVCVRDATSHGGRPARV